MMTKVHNFLNNRKYIILSNFIIIIMTMESDEEINDKM